MVIEDAIKLAKRLIETEEKHRDYQRTVDLAETYKIYITGENISKKLEQFVRRESAELYEQRIKLTRSITPAVSSSIRQPFNKVVRNDRIKKGFDLKGAEGRKDTVEKMINLFYGAARKKNRGVDYWLKTRFLEMQFIDPNSWAVVEWDTPEDEKTVIKPRPFEVSAAQAHNFFVVNDEVRWLWVCQDIKYDSLTPGGTGGTGTSTNMIATNPAAATAKPTKKEGLKWTLYDEALTLVYEEADRAVYQLKKGEEWEKIKEKDYVVRQFDPKVGYSPAFRIGYKRDEATCGRTFVNPWHDALCFFDKSLKTVSELDLTMTLHVFPQKLQYVHKCPGSYDQNNVLRPCQRGRVAGRPDEICGECKGAGYKLHTSAQDAILLPMPEDKAEMIPLDDILVYKGPPIELVEFQNKYTQQLEKQAHQAVFNSQVFVKKNGGGMTESTTATEADFNMQSVYDALEPFTEKYSDMWREFITIFAVIAGETLENIEVNHDFPADYKLKTEDILMTERKTAQESGAPAFLIEAVDDDLAEIVHQGDKLGLAKYKVKRRYFPFTGKSPDEIAMLLASEYVPKAPKVLYSNFEEIFKELDEESPNFYVMTNLKDQKDLVIKKVKEWMDKLSAEAPKLPVFSDFKPITGGAGNAGGDGNPGNDQGQNAA